ncbi:MAG TPA: uracil-DNA glycosylase [Clostridia bacterium]|nr:uracil-DNA glycosylase [Clostridia bacterium]
MQSYVPVIMPEIGLPKEASLYSSCSLCSPKARVIWGEGNPMAQIMVVLDNPGAREDSAGKEYICGTRQTLQGAIFKAGLQLENIFLTYLLKCRPLHKYNKDEVRAFSRPFLIRQIEQMKPELLILLGDVVVQVMFENKETSVKTERGRWHKLLGTRCAVSYHPLAVRRRPNLMPIFLEDWKMVASALTNLRQGKGM